MALGVQPGPRGPGGQVRLHGGVLNRILGYVLDQAGTRFLRTSLGTPRRRVAGVSAYGHVPRHERKLARSLLP